MVQPLKNFCKIAMLVLLFLLFLFFLVVAVSYKIMLIIINTISSLLCLNCFFASGGDVFFLFLAGFVFLTNIVPARILSRQEKLLTLFIAIANLFLMSLRIRYGFELCFGLNFLMSCRFLNKDPLNNGKFGLLFLVLFVSAFLALLCVFVFGYTPRSVFEFFSFSGAAQCANEIVTTAVPAVPAVPVVPVVPARVPSWWSNTYPPFHQMEETLLAIKTTAKNADKLMLEVSCKLAKLDPFIETLNQVSSQSGPLLSTLSSGLFIGMFASGSMLIGNGLAIFPRFQKLAMVSKGTGLVFSGVASIGLAVKGSLPVFRNMAESSKIDGPTTAAPSAGSSLSANLPSGSGLSTNLPSDSGLAPGFGTSYPQAVVSSKKVVGFWDFFFAPEIVKIPDSNPQKKPLEADVPDTSD